MNSFFSFFLDVVSFNTPKARAFNLSAIFALLAIIPTSYLESFPIKCVFKHFLIPLFFNGSCPIDGIFSGCNCPACGMTRGMSRLLHGDFTGAYDYNKLVFLVFLLMAGVLIWNVYVLIFRVKTKKGL